MRNHVLYSLRNLLKDVILRKEEYKMAANEIECKTYSGNEAMTILGLPKTTAYKFFKEILEAQSKGEEVPFTVHKIGRSIRIPKEPFDKWFANL